MNRQSTKSDSTRLRHSGCSDCSGCSRKSDSTRLRHYIDVQSLDHTPDGAGGFTDAWTKAWSEWASVNPLKADQVFEYRSKNVHATHLIKVRGYSQLSELNRILFDGRTFEVLTVENLQERDFIKLATCKEVRA